MAYATKVTIGTGNKITQSYQSQDVSVSVSYELERTDTDLIAFMADKAAEVEACHTAVWQSIYGIRADRASVVGASDSVASNGSDSAGPPDQQGQARRTRKNKDMEAPAQVPSPPEPDVQAGVPAVEPVVVSDPSHNGTTAPIASEHTPQSGDVQVYEPATNLQKIVIRSLWTRSGHTPAEMSQLIKNLYGKATLDDLTKPEAAELTLALQKGEVGQPQAAAA